MLDAAYIDSNSWYPPSFDVSCRSLSPPALIVPEFLGAPVIAVPTPLGLRGEPVELRLLFVPLQGEQLLPLVQVVLAQEGGVLATELVLRNKHRLQFETKNIWKQRGGREVSNVWESS